MRAAERPDTASTDRLQILELESRVRELEETLDAIRSGEVDAIVVSREGTSQVYALEGPDHPYRALVENIQEGALTLTARGMILYGNTAFARMRQAPLERVIGSLLLDHIEPGDRDVFRGLLRDALAGPVRGDVRLCSDGGSVPVLLSMTPLMVSGETNPLRRGHGPPAGLRPPGDAGADAERRRRRGDRYRPGRPGRLLERVGREDLRVGVVGGGGPAPGRDHRA